MPTPDIKGMTDFGPVTLFFNTNNLIACRISTQKIFEIHGTSFDYDKIFNNKERKLYWHSYQKANTTRGDLYDLDR